ncbi:MAG TPA: type II toxin-antitoxin system prevent-host-death family antitoxin [Planctomycetota bacterium]|nr:type II toxin-antitoxin system prevent-host-death family antitoxin [Planctomycetota bacterium]
MNPPSNLVGAFEAKTRFGDLLERGEVIVITRHGHPVARLVPVGEPLDRERARAAADRLATFGDAGRIRLPKGVSIEDLINEGRE